MSQDFLNDPSVIVEEQHITSDRILKMLQVAVDRKIIDPDQIIKTLRPKTKGRKVSDLPMFTFSSGISVGIRTLGPFTIDAIQRSIRQEKKKPAPPRTQVNYGTEESPDFRWEENPADPNYKEELSKYEQEIEDAGGRRLIDTIINRAITVDVDYEEVSNMREFLVELGTPKDEVDVMTDHEIYIKHVCIKSPTDLTRLQQFVIGESMPTEERVQAHEDSFRGNVSRKTDQEVPGIVIGSKA